MSSDFLTSPAFSFIRWVTFCALLAVVGVIGFRETVLRRIRRNHPGSFGALQPSEARAARWGLCASVVLLCAGVARVAAQSHALGNPPILNIVLHTMWGRAWCLQMAVAAALVVAFLRAVGEGATAWLVATVLTVVLAFTPALSGHAITSPWSPLMVAADGLHVLGAGGWLGTLLIVVGAGIPAAMRSAPGTRVALAGDLIGAFSPTALVCATVVVLTGVLAGWVHVGTVDRLLHTQYGQRLLFKVGGVVVALALGAYHWKRATPRLDDDARVRLLRRSGWMEVGVGLYIVLITAVLVATDDA
jgi:putative copper export protein